MAETNRRVFPRAEGEYLAWYQLPNQSYHQCLVLDIGVDGACLLVDERLPSEHPIEVSFELSYDWTVKATAEILWQRQQDELFLVGVRYRPHRSSDRNLMGPWVHRQRRPGRSD